MNPSNWLLHVANAMDNGKVMHQIYNARKKPQVCSLNHCLFVTFSLWSFNVHRFFDRRKSQTKISCIKTEKKSCVQIRRGKHDEFLISFASCGTLNNVILRRFDTPYVLVWVFCDDFLFPVWIRMAVLYLTWICLRPDILSSSQKWRFTFHDRGRKFYKAGTLWGN